MFDYSLDKEESTTFVLNYEPMGENLKVNLASGDDYFVPNTKKHRQNIIDKMEE